MIEHIPTLLFDAIHHPEADMATLEEVIARHPFKSWGRTVAGDGPDQLNVAGLRTRSVKASAAAPVRAYLRRPDGTRELLTLVGVEVSLHELAVVVEPAG